jgi:Ca2+-binding EF-hand superfamily protein
MTHLGHRLVGSGYDQESRLLWWKGIMSDQYEAVFARYDTDGDGRLTVDEVTAAIAGMFPAAEVDDLSGIVKALFAEYDTDHDGLLSVTEFVPLADNLPELAG